MSDKKSLKALAAAVLRSPIHPVAGVAKVPDRTPTPSQSCVEPAAATIDRIAILDAERQEADLRIGRGYDCDQSAPSHAGFIERQRVAIADQQDTPMTRPDPNDYRETVVETHLRLDRLAVPQSASQLKAMELVRTCREFGVGLRLDPDGTLVVQSNGKAWRSLVDEIETHIDAVAELIMAGWDSTDA